MPAMQSNSGKSTPLGDFVTARREAAGISQRQLATRADLHSSIVSRVESGAIARPSARVLQAIARALSFDVAELLVYQGVEPALPEPRVYFRRKFGMNATQADVLTRLVEGFDHGERKGGRS